MSDSPITLVGNLGRDPDLRFTPAGIAVADLMVIVNHRTKQGTEWVDSDPEFWDVTVWRDLAEHAAESLSKGDRVVVIGTARKESWEKDGQTRSSTKVMADEVGPSLRWATATVTRAGKSTGQAAPQAAPAPARYEDSPF